MTCRLLGSVRFEGATGEPTHVEMSLVVFSKLPNPVAGCGPPTEQPDCSDLHGHIAGREEWKKLGRVWPDGLSYDDKPVEGGHSIRWGP